MDFRYDPGMHFPQKYDHNRSQGRSYERKFELFSNTKINVTKNLELKTWFPYFLTYVLKMSKTSMFLVIFIYLSIKYTPQTRFLPGFTWKMFWVGHYTFLKYIHSEDAKNLCLVQWQAKILCAHGMSSFTNFFITQWNYGDTGAEHFSDSLENVIA